MKTRLAILSLLAATALLQARDMDVVVKGTPRTSVADDVDSIRLDKPYLSNTVNSFMQYIGQSRTTALLPDVDRVEFGPARAGDSLTYFCVDLGSRIANYALDSIDSLTFIGFDDEDTADDDGDGLSNFDELNRFGTDPKKADTDGDGWADDKELSWFTPATDPHRFNPLIADLPSLEIVQLMTPEIRMVHVISETESEELGRVESQEFATGYTRSNSFATSVGMEHGWEVGFNQSFGMEGKDWKWEIGFEQSVHGSYTSESVTESGSEWSKENVAGYEQAETLGRELSKECNGGYVSVPMKIVNSSNIAYTVKAMTLTAYSMNYSVEKLFNVLGSLNLQDNDAIFQEFTLAPHQESAPMYFINSQLDYQTVKDWATHADGLVVDLAAFKITLTDDDGIERDFTHELTAVASVTAKLRVDYGPSWPTRDPLELNVATLNRYNVNYTSADDQYFPVTVSQVLETARLPIVMGDADGNRGIAEVDGAESEPDNNGYWFLVKTNPVTERFSVYSNSAVSYDPDTIVVGGGEFLELIYSGDADHDGLPVRLERILGASDTLLDSDADNLHDSAEVNGWGSEPWYTDPSTPDTDGDGVRDDIDPNPLRRPMSSSADIEGLMLVVPDFAGAPLDTVFYQSSPATSIAVPSVVEAPRVALHVTTADPMFSVTADGLPLRRDSTGLHYTQDLPLAYAQDTVTLVVTSEDESTVITYTMTVTAAMPTLQDYELILASDAMASITSYNGFRVRFDFWDMGSEGYEGLMFLYSDDSTTLAGFDPTGLTSLPASEGEQVATGIRHAFSAEFQGSSGTVTMNRTGVLFNHTYYVRPVTYQHNVSNDLEFGLGTIKRVHTTGRAIVTADMYYIYHVSEEDQGANAEYKWTIQAMGRGRPFEGISIMSDRYTTDEGDTIWFGAQGISTDPYVDTLDVGDDISVQMMFVEVEEGGEVGSDVVIHMQTHTYLYDGLATSRNEDNGVVVSPSSLDYVIDDNSSPSLFRKLVQIRSDDGDLDVYLKFLYTLVDTLE